MALLPWEGAQACGGRGGVEEGRVLLGQVLWNVRFLHFEPKNLLRSPPWHVYQEETRKLPSFLVLNLLFPARPLCRVQCARCTQLPTPGSETPYLGKWGGWG